MKARALTIASCLLLTACGFQPVYGVNKYTPASNSAETKIKDVDISLIPNAEGVYLRNALIDTMYRDGYPADPRYTLKVNSINENLANLDITRVADSTRGQLTLSASMRLIDTQTKKEVLSRRISAVTSYNILASEFSTRVSEENARKNALNDLARQIEMQIALYFKR